MEHMFLFIPIRISVLMFDVSPLSAYAAEEKTLSLVYLPTSSNLSTRGNMERAGSSCCDTYTGNGGTGKATNSSAAADGLYHQTWQAMKNA